MNLLQRFQQLVTLIETALLSRYSNPEMYQQYVVESGRRELAQEVASVVRSSGDKINSTKLRVLDVAAGTGLVSQALLQEDCSVTAFDHSAEMLEALKEQFKGITTQVGDMNQPWPFANEQFDAVTIVWGNRYIVDPEHFSQEVFRVLKPGGTLVWPIFWLEQPLWWLFLLRNRGLSQLFSIFQLTPTGLAKMLAPQKCTSIKIRSSKLGKKVGWWQKPSYLIAKKAV